MKIINIATVLSLTLSIVAMARAEEDHKMREVCKAECPAAKDEQEAHKCVEEVAKKKKADKKFRKSDCFAAYREHEKHEKEEGHKH